jgi:hypothetical protein
MRPALSTETELGTLTQHGRRYTVALLDADARARVAVPQRTRQRDRLAAGSSSSYLLDPTEDETLPAR